MRPRTLHMLLMTRPAQPSRPSRTYAVGALMATLVFGLLGASTAAADVDTAHARTVTTAAGTAAAFPLATTVAAHARTARTLPGRIGARPKVHQMITVSAKHWSARHATLKAWQREANGHWRLVHGPVRVVIGYNGWVRARERVQSTGTTPAGRFRLPYAFGRLADPGAHLDYRRFDRNDWWPYEPRDPSTYNVWQWHKARTTHWRSDKSEHLWDYYHQYAYGVVVGFNLPSGIHYSHRSRQWVADDRADTRRGGGIFLHVRDDGPTAGCVAMRRAQVQWLIRWLRPGGHPQIVMGPYDYIANL
jgi:L,D-peptidoglycan transpeptidase YkuD (ErfK/YbiS/YcfS/YnhG family)